MYRVFPMKNSETDIRKAWFILAEVEYNLRMELQAVKDHEKLRRDDLEGKIKEVQNVALLLEDKYLK